MCSIEGSIEGSIAIGNSSWVLATSLLVGTPEHLLAIGAVVGDLYEIFGGDIMVEEGTVIPDESVVGRPAKVIRKLIATDKQRIARMRAAIFR